ncbi:MAG: thioredoxin domain-containing protein [Polyangiaceae bacterium]|nr:thioredoxin domain-containing protein [Polyangiaceae bacterium]
MFRPGMTLGQSELVAPVTDDGITAVWRARRRGTGEPCIVEVLSPGLVATPNARVAFLAAAGAIATATLDRRILRVFEVDEDPATQIPFITTAEDPGPSLAHRLEARGPLALAEVAGIVRALPEPLRTLHDRGRGHGDLSPRNLVLPEGPGAEPVLRGFVRGALAGQLPQPLLSAAGPYVAPELCGTGCRPTPASDVFSLALLALASLTGDEPPRSWDPVKPSASGITRRPSLLRPAWAERLPNGFDEWFLACVYPVPGKRLSFGNAARNLSSLLVGPREGWPKGRVALPGAPEVGAESVVETVAEPFSADAPVSAWEPPPEMASAPMGSTEGRRPSAFGLALVVGLALLALAALAVVGVAAGVVYFEAKRSVPVPSATAVETVASAVDPGHAFAAIAVGADDPISGAADAPVTMVVFGDFACPFCAQANIVFAGLRKEFAPTELRVVWKHYPLPSHPNARPAHEAGVATFLGAGGGPRGSEAFFHFYDLVFSHQEELGRDELAAWAVSAGAPQQSYQEALVSGRPRRKVDLDIALGKRLGVDGTPTCFINGIEIRGVAPEAKYREVIEAELVAGRRLMDGGTPRSRVYVERVAANSSASGAPFAASSARSLVSADDGTIWRVAVQPDDPVMGPADALVTIVEFGDFACSSCARARAMVGQLREQHPVDIRWVWKDNPLPDHPRGKPAAMLARLAFAGRGNTGFFRAHDALFAAAALDDIDLQGIATGLGLSWPPADAMAIQLEERTGKSLAEAAALEVRGSPTFFINGQRVTGAEPSERFEAVFAERLAAARALETEGVPRMRIYERLMADAKEPGGSEAKGAAAPVASGP